MSKRNHIKEKQGKFGFYKVVKGDYKDRVAYYHKDEFSREGEDDLEFYDGDPNDPEDQKNMGALLDTYDDYSIYEGMGGWGV